MTGCPPWCTDPDPGHEYHTSAPVDLGGGWSGHLGQADGTGEPVRVVTEDPAGILPGCELAQATLATTEQRAFALLALIHAAHGHDTTPAHAAA